MRGKAAASQPAHPFGLSGRLRQGRLAEGVAVNPHALSRWDRRQRLQPVDHKKAANFLCLFFNDLVGGGSSPAMT
jgi:hypothetical protein